MYEDNNYGFSIEKPDGWYSISSEELNALFGKVALPMLVQNNSTLNEMMSIAKQTIIPLFGFSQYPLNVTNGKLNANINGLVVTQTETENLENICEYFRLADKLLKGSPISIKSADECRIVDINGQNMTRTERVVTVLDTITLNQIQYGILRNGNFLIFTTTHFDDETERDVNKIMESLRFKN